MEKTYFGFRTERASQVWVWDGERMLPLDPCHTLRNHSPDGFEWGYGGSGPAQLALALCFDLLKSEEKALALYQDFKTRWVGYQSADYWCVREGFLLAVLDDVRHQVMRRNEARAQDERCSER